MFRSKILTRFLLRKYLYGIGTVLLTICGIIFAITFIERLPSNPTVSMAMLDSWTRLLEYIPIFLPMTVFMGTLFAFFNLTKSSEAVIITGSGISPFQMARPFLIGAAIVGIITSTLLNPYSVNLSSKNISAEQLSLIDNAIWLRESSASGIITLRAKDVSIDKQTLIFKEASVFTQTPDFKLKQRTSAPKIILSANGLDAKNAKIWNNAGILRRENWHTNTLLNPKTVLDRYLQPNQISFWKMPAFIKKMQGIGAPIRGHLIQFWTLLFLPLTLMSLTLLGVAFSQTHQRRNFNFAFKFGIGIITCFILYFLLNLFSAMGTAGALPTILAIIAPPFIIIAAAGTFIASFDTI